jgi:transposase
MHLVAKQVKGREYFYLVEKGRRDGHVVTTRTIYVGDRQKLAELIQLSTSSVFPVAFSAQSVGAALAMAQVASDLGLEEIVDAVCPVRAGAAPVGRRLVLMAIHRILSPRNGNGLLHVRATYEGSVLAELLPIEPAALDDRRLGEVLVSLTARAVEEIEARAVQRLVEREGVRTEALAFDCTNFDSYAGARTASRLLRRGHAKSGRSLRVLGLGLLATDDEGIPLVTFTYPGNENDVVAFGRFLQALDRRRAQLPFPLEATIAADGGNIGRQLLLRLEEDPRYYVMRLPAHHLPDLERRKRSELPLLLGSLKGKVWAKKYVCPVYGVPRCVVDVYSARMRARQLPGLQRDRDRARAELSHLQGMLERQRQGLRRVKPLSVSAVRRRVQRALVREHMATLFAVAVGKGDRAPTLQFSERPEAWQHLEDYVLGRTLLVTNRAHWPPEQIVHASRKQSHNEQIFRDLKDPSAVSMLPLRHRRDRALRAHALIVILGLLLAKVVQRRAKGAGVSVPSVTRMLRELRAVQRAHLQYGADAPPALRALADSTWVPSHRNARQDAILRALGLAERPELGTTLASVFSPKKRGRPSKNAA